MIQQAWRICRTSSPEYWALTEKQPATDWQAEINLLMRAQTGMLNYPERKHAQDRVQELVAQYDPAWSAPTLLVGAKKQLGASSRQ